MTSKEQTTATETTPLTAADLSDILARLTALEEKQAELHAFGNSTAATGEGIAADVDAIKSRVGAALSVISGPSAAFVKMVEEVFGLYHRNEYGAYLEAKAKDAAAD